MLINSKCIQFCCIIAIWGALMIALARGERQKDKRSFLRNIMTFLLFVTSNTSGWCINKHITLQQQADSRCIIRPRDLSLAIMGQCISYEDYKENTPENSSIRRHNKDSLQRHLVREQHRDFHDVYEVVGLIGEGSISNIYKIVKKKNDRRRSSSFLRRRSSLLLRQSQKLVVVRRATISGEAYALKEIDTSFVKEGLVDELRNEIDLLKDLDHPFIIKVCCMSLPAIRAPKGLLSRNRNCLTLTTWSSLYLRHMKRTTIKGSYRWWLSYVTGGICTLGILTLRCKLR